MSSQLGPKAAPGQHSAHILLGIILREPQSASANFLGVVGEGERDGWLLGDVVDRVGLTMQILAGLIHEGYSALIY